jgi:hypothetical protein
MILEKKKSRETSEEMTFFKKMRNRKRTPQIISSRFTKKFKRGCYESTRENQYIRANSESLNVKNLRRRSAFYGT